MKMIIFTDLDGSLLDHDTYSFAEAIPCLKRIKQNHIPLILVTSKTRTEVEALQKNLGISEPFIVENGGGIFFPSGYRGFSIEQGTVNPPYTMIQLGTSYVKIRAFIEKEKDSFGITGFGDLSDKEVASITGLSLDLASFAKQREFTEPFLLKKEALLKDLGNAAHKEKLKITRGGRFFHLIGIHQDKGKAVQIVKDIFIENLKEAVVSIGIGDSKNDIPMLEHVDIPILIPHPDGNYENVSLKNLRKANDPGSKGWNDALGSLLDDLP